MVPIHINSLFWVIVTHVQFKNVQDKSIYYLYVSVDLYNLFKIIILKLFAFIQIMSDVVRIV